MKDALGVLLSIVLIGVNAFFVGAEFSLISARRDRLLRGLPMPPKSWLTSEIILGWADQHFAQHGRYPGALTGPVTGHPGETWANIDAALRLGYRGLSGKDTLASLLYRERGRRTGPGR